MQSLFEMALAFLVMMTIINAGFVSFGIDVIGEQTEQDSSLTVSQQNLKESFNTSENTVKEGNVFDAILSYVNTLIGTVTETVGGIAIYVNLLLSFGNAWSTVLEIIFGTTGGLWTFISLAVIPTINLAQLGAVVYILLYVISAVRGGRI